MTIIEAMMAVVISLTGSHWAATTNSHQTVEFSEGRISGNAGCNRYFGSYAQNGNAISIGSLGTTRKACAPDVMVKESKFMHQLGNVTQYEMQANVLILKNAKGETLVTLDRKDVG